MKERLYRENNYLDEKYQPEGGGNPPFEIEDKVIFYIDENGNRRWILHPNYINPANTNLYEKAKKILEESKIWPFH